MPGLNDSNDPTGDHVGIQLGQIQQEASDARAKGRSECIWYAQLGMPAHGS
jgi:hypothetical protein